MHHNFAKMTSATSGTGTLTLGSAVSGWLSFANAGVVDGERLVFVIEEGTTREISRGVYTASGTTLTRDEVLASTNSGAKVSFGGTETVFIALASEDAYSIGPNYPTIFQDDFLFRSTESGEIGQLSWSTYLLTAGLTTAIAEHPGIITLTYNSTNGACLYTGTTTAGLLVEQIDELVGVLKMSSTADNDAQFYFGFMNSTPKSHTNSVHFERSTNDTGWHGVVTSASSATRTAELLADDTSFHKFKIKRISSTSWSFSIDDATPTLITDDANIPGNSIGVSPLFGVSNNTGSTSRVMHVDYFHLKLRMMVR